MALTREVPSRKGGGGGLSSVPLVGRIAQLEALRAPQPPAALVIGEMGAGKSRLLAEARLQNDHRRVFTVACQRGAALLPLDPLITLVRIMYRDGLLPKPLKDAVTGASERDRLSYIREALETAAGSPLVLQIDDLHWADADTPDALRYCIDRLQDAPIKWHVSSRVGYANVDEFAFGMAREGLAEVLLLDGLTLDELRSFAEALGKKKEPACEAALSRLYERTGGNPLYAELLLTNGSPEQHEIPRTLRWALFDRLGSLTPVARDVAAWIAVHRGPLQQGAIAALSQYSPAQVLTALTELSDKGIARKTTDGYAFRHELLRDVCYESIEEPVRAQRHQALAARTDDDWQRAGHFDGAKRYEEAAAILAHIGWDRLDRDAPTEALAAFERALERVNPDSEAAWEARAGLAAASYAAGKIEEAYRHMRDFEGRAPSLTARLRVIARCRFADAVWTNSQDNEAMALPLQSAIAEASDCAPDLLPRLLCIFGASCERQGRLEEAQASLERGIAHCDGRQHEREAIRLRAWLGVVRGRLGAARDGIALLEDAVERASAAGMSNELATCCTKLCYLCDMIGDHGRYEYWCRRGLDVAGPKSRRSQALLMNNLAYVASDAGRLQEALGLAIASAAAVEPASTIAIQALCLQADLYAMLGDMESAARSVADARTRPLSASWRRAVEFTGGFVAELDEQFDRALLCYDRAIGPDRTVDEVYDLRALTAIVRASVGARNLPRAHAALERLRAANQLGWPVARQLAREAEAYWQLASGDKARASEELLEVAVQCPDRYWQAHLRMVVADVKGDRDLFNESIDAFDALGAAAAGDKARSLARAHGLRPGRKREGRGNLSEREISVALLVASGKTNVEIGDLLHVSPRTVEYHLGNVMSKCGLRSRIEIAIRVAAGTLLGGSESSTTA
jgi:DNA-binding CsgD family transcriptional regulator